MDFQGFYGIFCLSSHFALLVRGVLVFLLWRHCALLVRGVLACGEVSPSARYPPVWSRRYSSECMRP